MARKPVAKRIKPRNPLAPVVRGLTSKVKPSIKAYTRKPKHKRSPGEDGEPKG